MSKRSVQGEVLGDEPARRLEADVTSALRRKPTQEPRLAGVLRALAPYSPSLRELLVRIADTLVRRGSYQRPLFMAAMRSLAELDDRAATPALEKAFSTDSAGGLPALSAACFSRDPALAPSLVRVATSRHPHLSFAAEVARVIRGESDGEHITSIAPKIKESHRIALCSELFVPLLVKSRLPPGIIPALAVLRDSERHLGRWLVFGEIASRAGDRAPLEEAEDRAKDGPQSARAAWSMVGWALAGATARAPSVRPTVELVARLSDRPSADRDTTFLYRLAAAGIGSARPMLEALARGTHLGDEVAIRAAMHLARAYGREDLPDVLGGIAANPKREPVRGVAAAALYDVGQTRESRELAEELVQSRQLATVAWGGLIRAAGAGELEGDLVLSEPSFRRIQLGWVE